MKIIRGLLALLVLLPGLMVAPAAVSEAQARGYGAEHCAVETEPMDMIFIRLKPTNYARIEKRLTPGDCGIDVTGHCKDGWCPVRQGRFDGWMHRAQLVSITPAVYCVARAEGSLDVHEGPGRSTKVVVSLHSNACGIALTPFKRGHWVRIKVHGHYGWVGESNIQ
jgi:SH3-like domain-containing protein